MKSTIFKGIKFPAHLAPFLPYMESMNDHREGLRGLQGSWDTLSLLGHLSSLRADMSETRESFDLLTTRLLGSLAEESFARVTASLGSKAQFAIDILVRNLFERTADIGFLATDAIVVQGCASGEVDTGVLRQRFADYVKRYSVYRDVALLGGDGQVLCQLKDTPAGANDPAFAAMVMGAQRFVERYATSSITGTAPALVYAAAVRTPVGSRDGVLALVFDLAGESSAVFEKLRADEELVAFVDASARVVLSSDDQLLPAGYRLPSVGTSALVRIGGCNYVAVQRAAAPYQGYVGPGWSAVAMVPADVAFRHDVQHSDIRFSGETVFSADLRAIPQEAAAIQRRLERIVWNGRLQQTHSADERSSSFSRALLEEIANTGRRTKAVFETSTTELLDTAAGSLLNETRMLSALAVDILDRNLFERACDCRWWAEDAVLQSLDSSRAADVLRYINGLYTVYTDIVVFDTDGRVIASSAGAHEPGVHLGEDWVLDCLGVTAPLGYSVSSFGAQALYGNRPTYIYSAPLRSGGRLVGGVALVFDAQPQFRAMCDAALPARSGAITAFVRQDGTIISSTAEIPVALGPDILGLAAGAAWSGLLTSGEQCFALSATAGAGYREFKNSDGYEETVIAVVIVPCGTLAADSGQAAGRLKSVSGGQEIATFEIAGQAIGVHSRDIVECIDVDRAVRVPQALGTSAHGYTPWRNGMLPLVDISSQVGGNESHVGRQAVVMALGDRHFGLVVSELGPIVELEVSDLPISAPGPGGRELMTHVARSDEGMVPLLSPAGVAEMLSAA